MPGWQLVAPAILAASAGAAGPLVIPTDAEVVEALERSATCIDLDGITDCAGPRLKEVRLRSVTCQPAPAEESHEDARALCSTPGTFVYRTRSGRVDERSIDPGPHRYVRIRKDDGSPFWIVLPDPLDATSGE